jgi:hypothetical protein
MISACRLDDGKLLLAGLFFFFLVVFFFFCWWFVVGSRWLRIDFPMVICCMSVRVQDNFLVRVKGESVWMACDSWWSL